MTSLRRQASFETRREAWLRLSPRHRFVLRHRRRLPRFIVVRAVSAHVLAFTAAEAGLPRRYRRALRGQAMRPSQGSS